MNAPDGYVNVGDAIDKSKVHRVQAEIVDILNREDINPVEGVVILNTLLMSLAQTLDPAHRWQLRADFVSMVLRAAVKQDSMVEFHNQPEAVQ